MKKPKLRVPTAPPTIVHDDKRAKLIEKQDKADEAAELQDIEPFTISPKYWWHVFEGVDLKNMLISKLAFVLIDLKVSHEALKDSFEMKERLVFNIRINILSDTTSKEQTF